MANALRPTATVLAREMLPDSADGRTRRAARSRAAIEDALFALVGEGILQPTMQEVAARAGVAMRSVFRHYSDMEGLFAAVDARLRLEALPLLREPDAKKTLAERLRGLVRQRTRVFERIGIYKRAADVQRWRSPYIQSSQRQLVDELRVRLHRWLPELDAMSPDVQAAVEMVLSLEAWDRLRNVQGLGAVRTVQVMERTAATLLGVALPRPRRR
jgi:AcrR family transcriptional regulator